MEPQKETFTGIRCTYAITAAVITRFIQGRWLKLEFKLEFEYEFEYRIYYTFKFKFKFKVVVHHLPKNRGYPKKKNALPDRERGNARPGQVCSMPDGVHGRRADAYFMKHMRLNYPEVIKITHPRYGTIVSAKDLLDHNTKNNEDDEDLY